MEITTEIIKKTAEMLENQLNDYREAISEAYSQNSEQLEIALKVRFTFKKDKFKIQTDINFVTDRIKDKSILWYDPNQAEFDFSLNGDPPADETTDEI